MLPERWKIPLEVCEKIIDGVEIFQWDVSGYQTLRACALVCRAWLPRSRICLFRFVRLDSARTASRCMSTVTTSPGLGQLVQTLCVSPSTKDKTFNGWICKVLQVLPPLLTNLYELHYWYLPTVHPVFHMLSSRFTTVKSLLIRCFFPQMLSFREIIQIVNGFKNLEKLIIYAKQKTPGLCYWKRPCQLKTLIADNWNEHSNQDIYSWLEKSVDKKTVSFQKLYVPLFSNIIFEPIFENHLKSLQSLQLDILDNVNYSECKYTNLIWTLIKIWSLW